MSKTTYQAPMLRTLRENAGITQEQLSTLAKVGRQTVIRLERGEGANGLTLARIAKALGVSREELQTEQ